MTIKEIEALLDAVKMSTNVHSNGQLAFIGAGQEYSGFIIDSTNYDAKEILGEYVKYVPQHINNEVEVLALPSASLTGTAAIDNH